MNENLKAMWSSFRSLSIEAKIVSIFVLMMLVFMVFVYPYTSGYSFSRSTLATQMATLYTWQDGEWMFGYAILPLIFGIFVFKYPEIREVEIKGSWSGLAIIVFSFLLYWVGYKTNNRYFGFIAMQLLVAGLIFFFLGWKMFWQLKWLWILLGLIWPLIFLTDFVSLPLRLGVTSMTSGFLNLIGVDTVRNGTSLVSAATNTEAQGEYFSLDVAAACSGIRSLFALLLIGIAYSYVIMKTDVKRCWLLLSIIPLIMLGNFMRMIILLVGVVTMGNEFAIGSDTDPSRFHIGAGLFVYVIVLSGLFFIARIINGEKKLFKKKKKLKQTIK